MNITGVLSDVAMAIGALVGGIALVVGVVVLAIRYIVSDR